MHYCFNIREVYFIRHGQTELNQARRYTGRLDYPLNPNGIVQAQKIKSLVGALNIERVYCSSLLRAKQTASLISDIKPIVLKELDERDFGVLTGAKKPLYNKNFFPNGESLYSFRMRVKKAISKMILQNAVIVSHSRVFQMICVLLELPKIKIQNGEIVGIGVGHGNATRYSV